MKTRRIPERMCAGCSERRPKPELIRIVRSPEGGISIDKTGKKPGRGAYICNNIECLRKVRKSGRLGRLLSCEVPPEIYACLEEELVNG